MVTSCTRTIARFLRGVRTVYFVDAIFVEIYVTPQPSHFASMTREKFMQMKNFVDVTKLEFFADSDESITNRSFWVAEFIFEQFNCLTYSLLV